MDNHPIPQDVTGFQFKLIGDMTIKQFAYLAGGVISGWIFFSLPITSFIRFPASFVFILTGITFAFIPIAGRPVDVMLGNFIKSLFSPTQYVYKKSGQSGFLPNLPAITTKENPIDALEKQKEKENESLQKKETVLEKELEEAKTKEASPLTTSQEHQKVISLEQQLQEILFQKEELAQQIVALQKKLQTQPTQNKPVFAPTTLNQKAPTQNVRKVPKTMARSVGLPITPNAPNIVTGIVKDPRGNPLPNILIEIKDKDDNPVRAFKTTLLGQFASATALTNGTYTINFEDPKMQNKFDAIEVQVTGEIIMPIEVRSIDQREELRKSLFGKPKN